MSQLGRTSSCLPALESSMASSCTMKPGSQKEHNQVIIVQKTLGPAFQVLGVVSRLDLTSTKNWLCVLRVS